MPKPASKIIIEADFHIFDVKIYKGKQSEILDPEEDEKIIFSNENQTDEPLIHVRMRTWILVTLLTGGEVGTQLWRVFF